MRKLAWEHIKKPEESLCLACVSHWSVVSRRFCVVTWIVLKIQYTLYAFFLQKLINQTSIQYRWIEFWIFFLINFMWLLKMYKLVYIQEDGNRLEEHKLRHKTKISLSVFLKLIGCCNQHNFYSRNIFHMSANTA